MSKRKFTDEELKDIIDKLFKHFNKTWILESEFKPYLEAKGYTNEEIEEIWGQAYERGLIQISSTPVNGDFEFTIVREEEE